MTEPAAADYFSESGSGSNDEDYHASDTDAEEIQLELVKGDLPTHAMQYIVNKPGWGLDSKLVKTRVGKAVLKHIPAAAKVKVHLLADLQPTSSSLIPDLDALWLSVTGSKGNTVDRVLLVAMEICEHPKSPGAMSEWGLSPIPPVQDIRIVHAILDAAGVKVTDELKTKLQSASRPGQQSLSALPDNVQKALTEYGGFAYGSATFAHLERMQTKKPPASKASAAAAPKSAARSKPKVTTPTELESTACNSNERKRKIDEPDLACSMTFTGSLPQLAKLMRLAAE